MKKVLSLIVLMLATIVSYAQISVSATAGTTGPTSYLTLNAAFAAINAGTHQGVISISVTGNTTEPATPIPLLKSAAPSNYTSVSIMPVGGNWIINSAATPLTNRGIIEFNGADNVTIDGDDPGTAGTRNLSFVMALNATTGTTCVRFGSMSTTGLDGATNNTVKNCIITGGRNSATSTTATYGIVLGGATAVAVTTTGHFNHNNTFENNLITRAHRGIYIIGALNYASTGIVVRNNVMGSATSASNIGLSGIYITYCTGILIEGNDIRVGDYGLTGYAASVSGIDVNTTNNNAIIRKNNIHDVYQTSTGGYGAYGINFSGISTGVTIENNFIRDIVASKYTVSVASTFTNYGIRIASGCTGMKINHNTIALLTANPTGTVANYVSYCVASTVSGVTISEFLNNILVNNNNGTGSYGFHANTATNISGGLVNNNCYHMPNGGSVGYISAAQATLSSWQTATSKDGASIYGAPGFVSTTDLHIDMNNPSSSNVGDVGAALPTVATDIDGETRSPSTPDIGADEFTALPCSGVTPPGNTLSSSTNLCSGYNFTLSVQFGTPGSGVQYQWESADDSLFTTNLALLGTGSTQTTSSTTPKYYRCSVSCGGSGTLYSNPIFVNVFVNPALCAPYCIPAANCSFGDLIASVSLNTLVNNSGTGCAGAFVNYTTSTNPNHTTTLLPSTTYNCVVGSGAYTQDYAAWIDYNDDGVFDASERIGYTTTALAAYSTASFPITLACTPPAGPHRLRVRSAYLLGGINITPCASQTYGETEDYLITIAAPPACPSPGTLSVTGTTHNTASLSWILNCATATEWDVQYGPTGFTLGTGTIVSNISAVNNTIITGLASNTAYQFYIRANCGANGTSAWSLFASGTTTIAPCSSQPNAGVAVAPANVCASTAIALSATGITNELGITYQWESSTDSIVWTPISGATTSSYTLTTGALVNTWFRLVTTCTAISLSNTSTPAYTAVVVNPALCAPYCIPSANCSVGDLIASVTLNTLVNNSGTTCTGAYVNYTTSTNPSHTTTLLPSTTYNCVVGSGAYTQDYAAWIDYNDDGTFAANERIGYTTTALAANSTASFPITLACTPPSGQHRLRVRSAYLLGGINITPCDVQSWGETEDYIITIAAPPLCPSPGALSVTSTTHNSATLSWVLGCATATEWDIQYGPSGFTLGNGTTLSNVVATNSTVVTGLATLTAYDFYIRANCGVDGTSGWSLLASGTTTAAPCSSQPNAGVAVAPSSVCSAAAIALSATGTTSDIGIIYQWESSTDSIVWTPISGATTTSYTLTTGVTVNTWFRLVTTCTATSQSNTSTTAYSSVVSSPALCAPYCIPTANCNDGDLIASVTLNTLVNVSGTTCSGAYVNYTTSSNPNHTTTLFPSTTYNCIVGSGAWAQDYAAWIDYNDDGTFSSTERIGFTTTTLAANSTATFLITLACTPPAGQHRLRVRSAYGITGSAITPCDVQSWGETEDYVITIAPPAPCSPTGVLSITGQTNTTVDLSWIVGCSTATAWDIDYGPIGHAAGTGTILSNVPAVNTYTVTNLLPATGYTFYVRSNCGVDGTSTWSLPASITTNQTPCSGTPATPVASSLSSAVCNGTAVTISATGYTADSNMTYQWYQSTDNGINWNVILGATNPSSVTTNLTGNTLYQLVSTCLFSSLSSTSNNVAINTNTPVVSASATDALCNGANGSITFSATGGNAPFSYTVNGVTQNSPYSAPAGTYTVIATNADACTASTVVVVGQPTLLTASILSSSNVTCFGGSNGTATASANGGTSPYAFAWSPSGGSASSASGLAAGTYTVLVSDANACTATITTSITQPAQLTSSASVVSNVSCYAGNNGSATAIVSGGVTPYSYSWSPSGGSLATASGLTAGTYTINVSDANSCTVSTTIVITQPALLEAAISASTDVSCFGGSNGAATVNVAGGTASYAYSWSPVGGTSATASGLSAGTYTVSIVDANSCTTFATVTINQPALLTANISAISNVSCNGGNDGTLTASSSFGTMPHTYSWSPSGGNNPITSPLSVGSYTVTVTDANGCSVTTFGAITSPPVLTVQLTSSSNVSCNGGTNGSFSLTASGGVGSYTYTLLPSNTQFNGTASGLSSGTYTVVVTDANLCTTTTTVSISEPSALVATIASSSNVICNGQSNGMATASVTGGTSPYTYLWSPTGGTNASASGLSAGTYQITITDANACTASTSVVISEPNILQANVASLTNISCNGLSDGTATIGVLGGTSAYSYTWLPSGGNAATASNLGLGTYTVTVSDANACSTSITLTITEPSVLTASITSNVSVTCFGGNNGSLSVTPNGGTTPYSYVWNPNGGTGATTTGITAGSYTVVVSDANGCTVTTESVVTEPAAFVASVTSSSNVLCFGGNNGSASVSVNGGTPSYTYSWSPSGGSSSTANGLTAGTYTVNVSDAYSCATQTVVTITEPNLLVLTASATNAGCNGSNGSLTFSATGGSGAVSYKVNGVTQSSPYATVAGTYTVVATDANGCSKSTIVTLSQPSAVSLTASAANALCNGTNGSLSFVATGGTGAINYTVNGSAQTSPLVSAPGVYTIVASDINACTSQTVITVSQPSSIVLTASANNPLVFGGNGSLLFSATGGTGNKIYKVNGVNQVSPYSAPAGTYTVVASDANNCSTSTILVISQPNALAFTTSVTDALCNGAAGTLVFSASGGAGGITYKVNGVNAVSPYSAIAGTYTVSATDANNATITTLMTVTQPTAVVATQTATNALCFGANGSLTFSASGGTGNKTFTVNGNVAISPMSAPAGTYTIIATDINGCTGSTISTITEPASSLSVSVAGTNNPTCVTTGFVAVTATGGTGNKTYTMLPISGTQSPAGTFTGLVAGTYTIVATDANGCTATTSVALFNPSAPTLTVNPITPIACNGGTTSITVSATGGSGPYLYNVNGSLYNSNNVFSNLVAGTYNISAKDANNCTVLTVVTVTQPSIISLLGSTTPAICNGGNGQMNFMAFGGTGAFTYTINGTPGTSPYVTTAGTYTIVAKDANNCTGSTVLTVSQPAVVTVGLSFSPIACIGGNSTLTAVGAGGNGIHFYSLDGVNFQSSNVFTNKPAGTYTVTCKDGNNCSVSSTITITQPTQVAVTASAAPILCNNTQVNLTAVGTGGTGIFTYTLNGGTPQASGVFSVGIGNYTVVASDANNCSASTTLSLSQPTAINLTASSTNALCNSANGSLTFSANGGTGTITYQVNGTTQTSPYATVAGSYTVVASDANACSVSTVLTITEPNAITFNTSVTNALCNGLNGSLTFSASGGTGSINYTINGTSANSPYTGLAGTYTLVATDANACTASTVMTITQPTTVVMTSSATNALCNGTKGALTFNATGGSGVITYTVNGNAASSPFLTLAGTYTVVASDFNACSTSAVLTITEPTAVIMTANATNALCNGINGSLTFGATGGTGTINYTVNGSSATSPYAGLAGTYTVVATDANACSTSTVLTITQPTSVVLTASATNALCNGVNGSLTFNATGGTGSISYTVNGVSATSPFAGLAGTYTVVATDANNCSTSTVLTISQPTEVVLTANATNALCNGVNGSLTFSATGGTGTISYKVNGTTQISPFATAAGTYTVVATDANNCSTSTVLTISQPTAVVLTANATNALCNGVNGSLTFSATGGTGTISYKVNGITQTSPFATAAGTYTVVATDVNNCSTSTVLTISQPTAVVLTANATNALCNGVNGSLTFSATGGTGTISYTVNGTSATSPYPTLAGTYTVVATDANACSTSTVLTISQPTAVVLTANATNALCNGVNGSLTFSATGGTGAISYKVNGITQTSPFATAAGTYTVVATDVNNCSTSTVLTISQPTAVVLTANATNALCNGVNGSLTFSATGGTGAIIYKVNGITQTSPFATAAGTYTVVATDVNNCSTSTVLTISQPTAVVLTANATNALCNGVNGSLTFSATGGTGTISYKVNGITQTSPFATAAGTYTVVATDANNCSTSTVLTISQPTAVVLTANATNALCNGVNGSLTFSATGGTGTISYKVNGITQTSPFATVAGTYTVVATDANACSTSTVITINQPAPITFNTVMTSPACNGGTGSFTFSANGGTGAFSYTVNGTSQTSPYSNIAGSYTLVATDANSCTSSTVVVITEPTTVVLTASSANALCNSANGSLTFNATGGTGVMTYTVNGTTQVSPFATGAGTYTVIATDANACSTQTVLVITQPATSVSLSIVNAANPTCNLNGIAVVSAAGGTGNKTYSISPNVGIQVVPGTFSSLTAGMYTITATDVNGCTSTVTLSMVLPPAPVISIASTTPILCNGGNSTISVSGSGGLPPYTYSFNGNPYTSNTTFTNNVAGTYNITIKDANACTMLTSVTISQPAPLTATASSNAIACNGGNSTLNVTATGGTLPYSYSLNGGTAQSSASFTGVTPGIYTIVVTDANACSTQTLLNVTQPIAVALTATYGTLNCNGSTTTVLASGSGGTGTLQYSLNGGTPQSSNVFNGVGVGAYTLTVSDANSCSASTVFNLTQPSAINLTASSTNALCNGGNGGITFSATGGTGTLTYVVNGTTQSSPYNTTAGTYTVVVTDANLCNASTVVTISQPTAVSVTGSASSPLCNGGNGSLTFSATGGTGTISYTVNGVTQSSPFITAIGSYTVVATDVNNCSASSVIVITQPTPVVLNASGTNPLCNGNNGSISFTATGGTGIISYTVNGTAQTSPYSTAAGTYTIVASDVNNCSTSTTVVITEPSAVVLSVSNTAITCNNGTSTITASATGGNGLLFYSLDGVNFQSSGVYSNQTAGTYTITAKDGANCSVSTVITITQPTQVVLTASSTNALCNGSNGELTFAATGGTGTMSYTVNGTAQTSPYTTTAGTYTVVASDANACSTSTVLTITEPTALSLTASATNALCNAINGSLTFSATGGTGTINYTVNGTAQTSPYSTAAGTYTVVATDANACSTSTVLTITEPTQVVLTASSTNALCNSANGSLTFSATGGTGTMTYTVNGTAATSPYATLAGTYTVVASDANACSTSTVLTITEPSAIILTGNAINALCNGSNGELSFSATGGTGTISYTVNGTTQTSPLATVAGTYTVVATDGNACTASTVLTITEPTSVVLSASATNALCNAINGSLTFSATGGTGTINYTVNGTAQTSPFATGAGTYTVVASDANNCSTSTVLTITEPTAINLSANATNALCNGINGSLTFSATGGTGTIGYTVNGTAQTSPFATLAGTYTVVATDANACSVSTVLTITEPSALVLSATTTAALCNGLNGSLTFSATGGTGLVNYTVNGVAQTSPYSSAAGTYTVVATDANACSVSTVLTITQPAVLTMGTPNITAQGCYGASNGAFDITSNGGTLPYTYTTAPTSLTQASTGNFTNVTNGVTYTVTLTDANGCSASTSLLLGTPNPTVLASGPPPICEGSTANIAALSIPAGVMTYSWQPGSIGGSNPTVGPLTTTTTYTVTGTDINGCTGTATITVDVLPAPVILTANPPSVCLGNTVAISALSIPTLPSTSFVWQPGTLNGASQNVTPTVTTVYTVMATDVNGCTSTTSITVAVNALPTVGTSVTPAQTVCAGTSVTMSGTGALTYSWSGVSSITDNTAFTSAVADAGTYTVTGTDINGCTNTATTTLTVNALPSVVASFNPASVCTNAISVPTATGATNYSWSGGVSNGQPVIVSTGLSTYTVTGTDANGCSATATASVIGNVGSGTVATNNTNTTMNQGDNLNATYYDPSCNLVAGIDDGLGGNVLGVTTVTLNIDSTIGLHNGQPFIRRWYQITPTSNGPANVTLYATQADFDNYNANVVAPYLSMPTGPSDAAGIANIRITKNDNSGLGNNPIVITPTVSWNGSYWTLNFSTPNFSQFRIHTVNPNNVPLPASVTSFTGRKLATANELNWITSSEQNNSHFMLQYSTDGVQFTDLAKVDSKAPNGNSQLILTYSYEHATPAMGHNYYRLKQVDIDGNSSLHAKVIDLQWGANGSTVTVYPNPTQGVVNIDVYATRNQLTAVKVMDMSGRVVKQVLAQSEAGMNKLSIDLGDVAQGLYTIQVYENDQLTHVERVRKSE